jgi:hypothetical protein
LFQIHPGDEDVPLSKTLTAQFDTRRDAEMAIERLVQQFDIERSTIFVALSGEGNSAGTRIAGGDAEAAEPSLESRSDAGLEGQVTVSVDLDDDEKVQDVRGAFDEFAGDDVVES